MRVFKRAVSEEAVLEEWSEIQAAQSDPAMFRPLYDRYFEAIFRFVQRRTADEELSADLCSQIFLKAMQKLHTYNFRGLPFSSWLFKIAANEVSQHYRQQQKNRMVSMEDNDLSDMIEEMEESDDALHRANLVKVLDSLDEKDLQLIEMRFFEQRPFKEIAEIMGITESNAKVKTYRILERLRTKLINLT
ncbi:MAG TPA: sigma-70 family RNA polymerase sigma factor [Saprospiraceae bacterium]|nr:sigma-70 family RNA polymerase sigma factor [Saprospiraceae bacterium]HMP12961.1 sigma-70 family RNA polymerase sigma factor [Saprospiraceae bacterium]